MIMLRRNRIAGTWQLYPHLNNKGGDANSLRRSPPLFALDSRLGVGRWARPHQPSTSPGNVNYRVDLVTLRFANQQPANDQGRKADEDGIR